MPNPLSSILVSLDGSDLAEQAIPFAQLIGGPAAKLILLAVVPAPEPRSEEAARNDLERVVARWVEPAATARVWREVAVGEPVAQILRVATEQEVGLIVLASHGRGAVGRWTFGSVADRVARTAPVPVLVIRRADTRAASGPVAIQRLLVPLDGSALAAQAVPVAADFAARLHRPVLVVRAIPSRGLEPEAWQTVQAAANQLDQLGIAVEARVMPGSPFEAIASVAVRGDVIVLTSRGRGGVRRWVLGSVAEQLVRAGPVPVVFVPNPARTAAP